MVPSDSVSSSRSEYSPAGQVTVLLIVVVVVACAIGCGSTSAGNGNGNDNGGGSTPPPATETTFGLVVLPDTQCYTSGGALAQPEDCGSMGSMEMFDAQISWIIDNRTSENIQMVVSVGDIVQCGLDDAEWQRASAAYQRLEAAGIPYVAVVGNHDYVANCGKGSLVGRNAAGYNRHFGPQRFAGQTWYGNSNFPSASNENSFATFEAAGHRYLVLGLEFYPRDAAIAWAEDIIRRNADREVIISTHAYLTSSGSRALDDDSLGPARYSLTADNNGVEMWDKLFSKHANLIAVVDGHFRGAATRMDSGDLGNRVAQMHSNYQFEGGQGFLRILRFTPAERSIAVRTYSPFLRESKTDANNEFTVQYGTP